MKKQQSEPREFRIDVTLTFHSTVTVLATSQFEAEDMGPADWVNDGMAGAELIDWENRGPAREAK